MYFDFKHGRSCGVARSLSNGVNGPTAPRVGERNCDLLLCYLAGGPLLSAVFD